eukprot:1927069-Rhodomonas_salina.1
MRLWTNVARLLLCHVTGRVGHVTGAEEGAVGLGQREDSVVVSACEEHCFAPVGWHRGSHLAR